MTNHDPLCPALEGEGLFVAYGGPAGGADHIYCLTCEAIRKVREDEQINLIGARVATVYAAALREAVEAVGSVDYSFTITDPETGEPMGHFVSQHHAVAAIEALGGER